MKRILPIIIVLCLLGTVFTCLPQSEDSTETFSLDNIANKKIGIQTGVNYELYLKEKYPEAVPVMFNDFSSMIPAMEQGKLDAILTESTSYPIEKIESPNLEKISEPLSTMGTHAGLSKSAKSTKLLEQLNEFIAEYSSDGTKDKMLDYWFENYDRENAYVDKSGITGENGIINFTAEASYEPVCFAGEGGELQGFEVEFIYRFCRKFGYEPNIAPLEFEAMAPAIVSGRIDIALGLIKDDERSEEINFSDPYYNFDIVFVYSTNSSSQQSFFENLKDSFTKTFIRDSRWQMFIKGAATTMLIVTLSIIFGTILGLLIYLWCSHGKKAEQKFTNILCWIMSSTPTVVFLMILYYIIFNGYLISNITVAIIGFTFIFGCGFYERIVSGVNAVGIGQVEAAKAQGFSQDQTFFRILLPQAARHFMPAYKGDVISIIQESSIVGYIAIMDLTKMSDLVRSRTYDAFFPLLATACIYFILIWILTIIISKLSKKLDNKQRKKEKILKGIKISENVTSNDLN